MHTQEPPVLVTASRDFSPADFAPTISQVISCASATDSNWLRQHLDRSPATGHQNDKLEAKAQARRLWWRRHAHLCRLHPPDWPRSRSERFMGIAHHARVSLFVASAVHLIPACGDKDRLGTICSEPCSLRQDDACVFAVQLLRV